MRQRLLSFQAYRSESSEKCVESLRRRKRDPGSSKFVLLFVRPKALLEAETQKLGGNVTQVS